MMPPRAIQSITYSCEVPTKVGLCSIHPGTLYNHEWKKSFPLFVEDDNKHYGIACNVKFRNGEWGGFNGYGIDDADELKACDLRPTVPNHERLQVVGRLVRVEFKKGGAKDFTNGHWVLAVNEKHDHLYIVPGTHRFHGVVNNPGSFFKPRRNPLPAGSLETQDPHLAHLIKYNIDGLLDELLAAEHHATEAFGQVPDKNWCCEKSLRQAGRHHGKELVEHLQAAGQNAAAVEAMQLKKRIDVLIDAKTMDAGAIRAIRNDCRAEFFPGKPCGGGVCQHDVSAPHVHENPTAPLPMDGVVAWTNPTCTHCHRTVAALAAAHIPHTVIDTLQHEQLAKDRGVAQVPFLEYYEHGKVRAEHLGELTLEGVKRWHQNATA